MYGSHLFVLHRSQLFPDEDLSVSGSQFLPVLLPGVSPVSAVAGLSSGAGRRGAYTGKKWQQPACMVVLLLAFIPFLTGHIQKKVLFLYTEDAEKKETACRYGAEYPLIVVYTKEAPYRSWYMANQVWPFQYVIYSDYEHMLELPEDPLLTSAEGFLVYMDAPTETLDSLVAVNPQVSGYTLLRKDPYFYVYLVE